MPNSFLTANVILRAALGLLQHQIVLPALVNTDYSSQFTGGVGDTISLGRPAQLHPARTYSDRSQTIVMDDISESKLNVTIGPLIYSAVAITDEQLTLDIVDFSAQVLTPQVRVVAEAVEKLVADQVTAVADDTVDGDAANPLDALVDAAVLLDQNNVPRVGRILVISPDVQAYFLKTDLLRQVNTSGTPEALRSAILGDLFGFRVVVTNGLAAGTAVAFVREAFTLVTRAPMVPAGVPYGATESHAGISMRWTRDYDTPHMQDRSVLAVLAGAATTTEPNPLNSDGTPNTTDPEQVHRAVKIDFAATP